MQSMFSIRAFQTKNILVLTLIWPLAEEENAWGRRKFGIYWPVHILKLSEAGHGAAIEWIAPDALIDGIATMATLEKQSLNELPGNIPKPMLLL